jgi:rhodanese-related sulfurtransferase
MQRRGFRFALLTGVASCAQLVAAQTPTVVPSDCPAAVIAMAGEAPAVRRPQAEAIPPIEPQVQQACRLAVEEYLRERANFILVDAREQSERAHVRIPGALPLSVGAIPSKHFLDGARVALVGTGLDDAELGAQCGQLHAAGMSQVRVLVGGVRALAQQGQPLSGDNVALADLDWVLPRELHRFATQTAARVVLIGIDASATLPASLEHARRWPVSADWMRNAQLLTKMSNSTADTPIVAVTADQHSAQSLHAALQAVQASQVYVLRDGIAAYLSYLDEQQRIAANANIRLIKPCGAS